MTIGIGNGLEEKFDANDYDSCDVYPESGNHRALLLPYSTCEDREGLCRQNILISWYKSYGLRMALCPKA